jgi:hypothetical protein
MDPSPRKAWSLPEREVAPLLPLPPLPEQSRLLTVDLRGALQGSTTVCSFDSISSLSPASGLTFLYKGRILCPALSFAFLRIQDGDEIYAIAPTPPADAPSKAVRALSGHAVDRLRERFDAKFSARFKDPEAVFEQFRDATDPVTARESARLADLFRTRVEENAGACRRVFGRLQQLEAPKRANPLLATVLPEKPLAPSATVLPDGFSSRGSGPLAAI